MNTLHPARHARVQERLIDELIGICRGILADGGICQAEVTFLHQWIRQNAPITRHWMAEAILDAMPADPALPLTEHHEQRLLEILLQATGDPVTDASPPSPSSIPVTRPPPPADLVGKTCCFTGRFAAGQRPTLIALTEAAGGHVSANVTHQTHVLIVGRHASPDWQHATHGRKIERALALGVPIATEDWWERALQRGTTS